MKENVEGYNFSSKKESIKKIFDTPEYQEYKKKSKATQKRKETVYKFTSIGNSTNVVRNLILINTILFVVSMYFIPSMFTYFASYTISSPNFGIWQPVTSMFLHGGWLHLIFNMIVLWSFGNQLDQIIGTKKFLFLYFISGIIGSVLWMFLGSGPAVGASGALCGLLSAYVFIASDTKVLLFFFIPMKIKNLVYGFAIFSLVFGLLSLVNPALGFGVGHFAHLGGLIGGYLIAYYWKTKNLIPTF
jgi:membrane associated rhomboid family serine protease